MYLQLGEIAVRDFERKDAPRLHQIVRETGVRRFMRDWSENAHEPEDFL
ncbi:MAG: hypothetical protein ACOYJR_04040 [Acutalibacteraceae bacterium]